MRMLGAAGNEHHSDLEVAYALARYGGSPENAAHQYYSNELKPVFDALRYQLSKGTQSLSQFAAVAYSGAASGVFLYSAFKLGHSWPN